VLDLCWLRESARLPPPKSMPPPQLPRFTLNTPLAFAPLHRCYRRTPPPHTHTLCIHFVSGSRAYARWRRAYNTPWGGSPQRYVGDGRPFWRWIVAQSTGCDNEAMFEEIFRYYETPEAWHLAPGAMVALSRLRAAGVRLAVVSNFDTRLRPLLQALGVAPLFDTLVVSAEVGFEKPCPAIFEAALVQLGDGLRCDEVLHVGDDRRNDVWGARDAGMHSLLWGVDVASFDELADRVLLGTVE
jgi:REG-2-like HAD superfamily hydrolase